MPTRRNIKTSAGKSKASRTRRQNIDAEELADYARATLASFLLLGSDSSKSLKPLSIRQSPEKPEPLPDSKSGYETNAEQVARHFIAELQKRLGISRGSLSALSGRERERRLSTLLDIFANDKFHGLLEKVTNDANLIVFNAEPRSAVDVPLEKPVSNSADLLAGADIADVESAFIKGMREFISSEFEKSPLLFREVSHSLEGLARKWASATIGRPEVEAHGPAMPEQDKKIFVQDGVRYRPLPIAAQMAQAPRQTLLNWVKNKTEFSGRPLQTYYLAPVDRYFVSEESIERIANRFIRWPSQKPAGAVVLGETKDRSGFLSMAQAAKQIGVSPRTMWLWSSQSKAPAERPLDVIKCVTSDHFYVREKDVYELKKLVPRSGLQRGRRSHSTSQPRP